MISLCLTNYNRRELLFEAFEQVVDDPIISEIVIVDDNSDVTTYQYLMQRLYKCDFYNQKVKLFLNEKNLDCYKNKREAVSKATNEWVILFDSDNIMTKDYVDRIYSVKNQWSKKQVLQPSAAKPHFIFNQYSGIVVSKQNVAKYMNDATFQTMLNAMNYFVNRDEYLRVWDSSVDPVTSDSLYQNYRWLDAGNSIFVLPELEYTHRVHSGSHYQNNFRRTPRGLHESIVIKLKNMS